MYDYLVVGAGLYGAVFAHEAKAAGKSVLVIDKRPNIAGNVFTEKIEGINGITLAEKKNDVMKMHADRKQPTADKKKEAVI